MIHHHHHQLFAYGLHLLVRNFSVNVSITFLYRSCDRPRLLASDDLFFTRPLFSLLVFAACAVCCARRSSFHPVRSTIRKLIPSQRA